MKTEILETDLSSDESLLSSLAEHKIEDLRLLPYSLMRQAIASDLCPGGSGGFWRSVMHVWICTLSEDQALDAYADLNGAKKRAFAWAESRGYSFSNWQPLIDIYVRLQKELKPALSAKAEDSGNGDELPNAGGQPA